MMGSHQQMTAREKDIYDTYSEDLERLTFNSKPIINSMTELANDYSSDFAHIIVRCIEDKIKVVPSSQKLPFLYLLDSILKNHKQPYQELLQQNIVSVFTHVFQNIPREQAEKSRLALYKLRCTWTDAYFSQIKLNQLDKKLQTVDPNWPIVPSKRNGSGARSVPPVKGNVRDLQVGNEPAIRAPGQSIHINPAVFARQPSITNSDADKLSLEEQMKKKEQELLELRVKNQQLKIEELQNKLLSGRELTKIEDQQQTAVKRSHQSTSQQVCNILNHPILLSIMPRSQILRRPVFINKRTKGHTRLPAYYYEVYLFRLLFLTPKIFVSLSTHIGNTQGISESETSRFPWNITSTWKTEALCQRKMILYI